MTSHASSYACGVFHFGSDRAFHDADGIKRNLKHDTEFTWEEVKTDSSGNVKDQPLLLGKPCFGRVETFLRFMLYDRRFNPDRCGNLRLSYSRCDECPISQVCQELVIERLGSSAEVSCAFEKFADFAEQHATPFLRSGGQRLWRKLMHAIISHGGWTSVNDARVAAHLVLAAEVRNEKRRQSACDKRKRDKQQYARTSAPLPLSENFISKVDAEFDRRLKILLDLHTQKRAPAWIRRLDEKGCIRTAEVWRSSALLVRGGQEATGKAIATLMIKRGVSDVEVGSLTTWVCKDKGRIQKLESDHAGAPIWPSFQPGC